MEQDFNNRRKEIVPGQTDSIFSEFDFSEFGISPSFDIGMPDLDKLSRDFQQESQKMVDQMNAEFEKMMRDVGKQFKEERAKYETALKDMTFEEYDEDGYHVMKGTSKDGNVVIRKCKKVGNSIETVLEVYQNNKVIYHSSSKEDSFSYRDNSGQMVTVKNDRNANLYVTPRYKSYEVSRNHERTVRTPHARIVKRKKKSTNMWGWLLLIAIAAVVLYMILR